MVKDPVLQSAIQHCNGSQLSQVVYLYTPINSLPHVSLDTYIGYRWHLKGKVEHKAIVISQNCSNPLYFPWEFLLCSYPNPKSKQS